MNLGNFWDHNKNADYRFVDKLIREMFSVSGVGVNFYLYQGVHDQGDTGDATLPGKAKSKTKKIKQIQDLFFLENRDRHYSTNPIEIKVMYMMNDFDFGIGAMGMMLESDTIYLEIHLNECLEKFGRKPLSGDVISMSHLRDDALLDEDAPAIDKFYAVMDVSRAMSGWSPLWRPHILRLKIKPMTASQEFQDILDMDVENSDLKIGDMISDIGELFKISDAIVEQSERVVPFRNFQTEQFYVIPGDEKGIQYPWIYAGDGKPPNGAVLAGKGSRLPDQANEGDWFLLTSTEIETLYVRENGKWRYREVNLQRKWQSAHRILESFINNDNITKIGNETFTEKQSIKKILKPRADF